MGLQKNICHVFHMSKRRKISCGYISITKGFVVQGDPIDLVC
jgi:hypothetical protein